MEKPETHHAEDFITLGRWVIQFVRGKAGKINFLKDGKYHSTIYLDLKKLEWVREVNGFIPAKQVEIKNGGS